MAPWNKPNAKQRLSLASRNRFAVPCKPDGHCLLYAAYAGLTESKIYAGSFEEFFNKLHHEVGERAEHIQSCHDAFTADIAIVLKHADKFFYHFNSSVELVDLMVELIATVYECKIVILTKYGDLPIGGDPNSVS